MESKAKVEKFKFEDTDDIVSFLLLIEKKAFVKYLQSLICAIQRVFPYYYFAEVQVYIDLGFYFCAWA